MQDSIAPAPPELRLPAARRAPGWRRGLAPLAALAAAAAKFKFLLAGSSLLVSVAACAVPLGLWAGTGQPLYRVLAFTGFLINLFNLLPVVPLDGGRAMACLSPWAWLVGLAALAGLVALYPQPILFLILAFGALES